MTFKVGSGIRLTNPPRNPEDIPAYLVNLVRDLENILNTPVLPLFSHRGWYDYNDLATQSTPLSVTGGVETYLTNDGQGSFTNKDFAVARITDVYNTSTNSFDFSGLPLGSTVGIRLDLVFTTTQPNQGISCFLNLGVGNIDEYSIRWGGENVWKSVGTHSFSVYNKIYIGNDLTKNNPAKLSVLSDDDFNVVVNGWFVEIH